MKITKKVCLILAVAALCSSSAYVFSRHFEATRPSYRTAFGMFLLGILSNEIKDYISKKDIAPALRAVETWIDGLLSSSAHEDACNQADDYAVVRVRVPLEVPILINQTSLAIENQEGFGWYHHVPWLNRSPVSYFAYGSQECRKRGIDLTVILPVEKTCAHAGAVCADTVATASVIKPLKDKSSMITDTLIVPIFKKYLEVGAELVAKSWGVSPLFITAYKTGEKLRAIIVGVGACYDLLGSKLDSSSALYGLNAQIISSTGGRIVSKAILLDNPIFRGLMTRVLEILGMGLVQKITGGSEDKEMTQGVKVAKAIGIEAGLAKQITELVEPK